MDSRYERTIRQRAGGHCIVAISSESKVISASLAQIETLLSQSKDITQAWNMRTELSKILNQALGGCMVVFSCLGVEINKIMAKDIGAGIMRLRARLHLLWNKTHINELPRSLRGQQSTMTLFIQLIQTYVQARSQHLNPPTSSSKAKQP